MLKRATVSIVSFILAVLASILAASASDVLKTHFTLFVGASLVVAALFTIFVGNFVGPSADFSRVNSDFQALWPKLSKLLAKDAEASIEVATCCRTLQNGAWPPQNNWPTSMGMVSDHIGTIRQYDSKLAKTLKRYFRADKSLRGAITGYKWLLTRDDWPAQRFKWRDASGKQQTMHQKVFERALDLEFGARDLARSVLRCGEKIGQPSTELPQ